MGIRRTDDSATAKAAPQIVLPDRTAPIITTFAGTGTPGFGGDGGDIIDGGAGNDVLAGGAGHDIFVFDGGGGNDVILDFTPGEDLLQISKDINGLDVSSPEDLASRITEKATAVA